MPAVYLDIETTWTREITVIGISSSVTGTVQLIGADATRRRLLSVLPKEMTLYTFNGHSFDLSVIRTALGLDLRARDGVDSQDLRYRCADLGLAGGQKAIERRLGFRRKLADVDGREAIRLWKRFSLHGDQLSLQTLLRYNKEDLDGLRFIKAKLIKRKR